MTDVWFRFFSLLTTQGVILAGLYWNRRQQINDAPGDQIEEIKRQVAALHALVTEKVTPTEEAPKE